MTHALKSLIINKKSLIKFPVSEPGSHPILLTIFVDFRCLCLDGVYPAIDISTPLNVTAAGLSVTAAFESFDFRLQNVFCWWSQDDSGRDSM